MTTIIQEHIRLEFKCNAMSHISPSRSKNKKICVRPRLKRERLKVWKEGVGGRGGGER